MITVTIYKTETGEIQGVYGGRSESIAANVPADCSYILGSYKSDYYRIVDGEPVSKAQSELDQMRTDDAWSTLRDQRDYELSKTDWTQANDAPLSDAQKQSWREYRQALRDLPANTADPADAVFPNPPS